MRSRPGLGPVRRVRWAVVIAVVAMLASSAGNAGETRTDGAPAPGDSARTWDDPFAGDLLLRYNRVDGATPGGRLRWHSTGYPGRRAALEFSYAAARRRGQFRISGTGGIDRSGRLRLAASAWSRTATFDCDDTRMGNLENTLSALLLADDNRDHLDARGGEASLAWRTPLPATLSLALRRERQRPLRNATEAALFNADAFRANPAATPGTLSALRFELSHDARTGLTDDGVPFLSRQWQPRGHQLRAVMETAGAGLGGDFRYASLRLEAAFRWPLTPGQAFAVRGLAGRAIAGRMPPQAEFAAGGATTLRGSRHKSRRGDRLALLNFEYAATVHRTIQFLALLDNGAAWQSDRSPRGARWALDGGAGVQTHDQRFRLILARPVRDSDAPWILSVRTRATF